MDRPLCKHRSKVYDTKRNEKDSCDVFSLLLDEEDESETVGEDSDRSEAEVRHKQNVLKMDVVLKAVTIMLSLFNMSKNAEQSVENSKQCEYIAMILTCSP